MTDNLLRRAADRLHATHGTPSVPPVVAAYVDPSGFEVCVWADGNMAVWHPGPGAWKPLPRADYAALFPRWPEHRPTDRPMGVQTFVGPEETQAEPDGPALGNVPTGPGLWTVNCAPPKGAPCAD